MAEEKPQEPKEGDSSYVAYIEKLREEKKKEIN